MDHGKGRMCGSRCLLQWELLFSSYLLFSTFVPIFLLIRVDQKLLILSSVKKKKKKFNSDFLIQKVEQFKLNCSIATIDKRSEMAIRPV